jgi:hypothetical protein
MNDFKEAKITINGLECTPAEAMTIRVALSSFMMFIDHEGLGEDDAGRAIAEGYKRAVSSVYQKMRRE